MKTAEASILILPGFMNSGPEHWQSRWEAKLSTASRVWEPVMADARKNDWVEALVKSVRAAEKPVVLVAHSLGVIATAHAAPLLSEKVRGAFLVAPSNVERDNLTAGIDRAFAPAPRDPLPFPSLLVASRNDPFCPFEKADEFAASWGSLLVDAGEAGHINVDAGFGPWPEGLMRFAGFLSRL
ncbi:MAG: alpha/beta hydrolase [Beijerinckiaceae bacterium]|nr:alpha/beta hydrolase [Beijerinckiaceae bacterium]